jgi:hypothetical protein
MPECLLNNQLRSLDSGQKTWGELLSSIESDLAPTCQIVTAVRFDGVDQPSFSASDQRDLPVTHVRRIEVESLDQRRFLRSTIQAAGESLPTLAAAACRAAVAFRGTDLDLAHRQLLTLVECVRTLTLLTMASATAAGADLDTLSCGSSCGADLLGGVGVTLNTLAQSQRDHDWTALADALEHDVAPSLLRWSVVFDAMHDQVAA